MYFQDVLELKIDNCVFDRNISGGSFINLAMSSVNYPYVYDNGDAKYNNLAHVTISNCQFTNNYSSNDLIFTYSSQGMNELPNFLVTTNTFDYNFARRGNFFNINHTGR
mmetsp:Transcript_19392/g.3161  ORF Transcript_19392/g.3161 Transcript_19392/m.3161 type:complete len:109 (+) Transcript_19392:2338-2664(+)